MACQQTSPKFSSDYTKMHASNFQSGSGPAMRALRVHRLSFRISPHEIYFKLFVHVNTTNDCPSLSFLSFCLWNIWRKCFQSFFTQAIFHRLYLSRKLAYGMFKAIVTTWYKQATKNLPKSVTLRNWHTIEEGNTDNNM